MSTLAVDPIPAPVRALATLFAEELAAVKFPDVDAASLAAVVSRVDTQQLEVTRLEEELARARAQLETSRDELGRLATRAHAYARVYAEDDAVLQARVDAITLPRARARPATSLATSLTTSGPHAAAPPTSAPASDAVRPKTKRKAPRDDEATQLFGDGSQAEGAAAE